MNPASAILSDCRRYRYYLQRSWHETRPRLCFIMLNPSTADETHNDATIKSCMGRGAAMGFGGIDIVNLFALRSTNPKGLYPLDVLPVSEPGIPWKNDGIIERVTQAAGTVICAWGKHGQHLHRDRIVLQRLRALGVSTWALKLNSDGSPGHPLYIPYTRKPIPFLHDRSPHERTGTSGA